MVKRLLSLVAVAVVATVGVQAQTFQVNPAGVQHNHFASVKKAPAKAATLDGTIAWGYYLGGASVWAGVGVNSAGVAFDVAIFVPGDAALKGASINGVNVPSLDAGMTGVRAWVKSELTAEDLASVDVAGPYPTYQFNTVAFDEPIAIPEEGLYVGYSFTCSVTYPVAFANGYPVERSLYLQYNNSGWGDYGTQFGASPLQVLLSNVDMADYSVAFTAIESANTAVSSEFTVPVAVSSNGSKAFTSIDYTVDVAGQATAGHYDFPEAIEAGFNKTATFEVSATSPAELGEYPVTVTIDKVNGADNAQEASISATFKNITKIVPRYTVVEEFTGTGCPWCTRGWAGMEMMKHERDNFIGIAFHKYNTSDPMYLVNYPYLGLTGAPGCVMDRKLSLDPYFGTQTGDNILYDFDYYNAKAPEAEITLKANFNADSTAVDFVANTEFLITPGKVSFVYVLTADGLKGTSTAWRQSNNYAGYQQGGLPYLDDFCAGGQYGQSYVYLTFDDVMIGSSYNASLVNQGQSVQGSSRIHEGTVYTSEYSVPMPTKATLKAAILTDEVYAVVLLVSDTTGEIINAAKVKVLPNGEGTGIATVAANAKAETYYSLDGRQLAAPQHGINIVRLADGTTKKVVVE